MSFVAADTPNAGIGGVTDPSPSMGATWLSRMTARLELDAAKDLFGRMADTTLQHGRFGWQMGPPDPASGSPSPDLEQSRHTAHEIFKPDGR
jgi:hypothetical protein